MDASPRTAGGKTAISGGRLAGGRGGIEARRSRQRAEVEAKAAARVSEESSFEAEKRRDIDEMADYLRVLAGKKSELGARGGADGARKPAGFGGAPRRLGAASPREAPAASAGRGRGARTAGAGRTAEAGRTAGGAKAGGAAKPAGASREARAAALEARLARQTEERAKKAAFVEHMTKGL